jgi:hypothetical protein
MKMTLSQMAAKVGKSERTVLRWINGEVEKVRLAARDLGNGMYEVDALDLQRLSKHEFSTSALDALERIEENQRAIITRLERIEAQLENRSTARHSERQIARAGPEQASSTEKPEPKPRPTPASGGSSEMPAHLVGWRKFARDHNIGESTVQKAIEAGRLTIIEGEWKVEKAIIKGALDAAGRAQFYKRFRANEHWQGCLECPHDID